MDGVHDKVIEFPSSRVTDENDLVRFKTETKFKEPKLHTVILYTYFSHYAKFNFNVQKLYVIYIYIQKISCQNLLYQHVKNI